MVTTKRNPEAGLQALPEPPGVAAALLRMPLYYKLILANGAIALIATVASAGLAAAAVRADPHVSMARVVWPIVLTAGVLCLGVNAIVVHFALTPLRNLARAAELVRDGSDTARAQESAVADSASRQLIHTFNNMLDNLGTYRGRLREIAIRAVAAGEAERLRISREVHDGVTQSLAATLVQLRVARPAAGVASEQMIDAAAERLTVAIAELRTLAQSLRPPALDMIGLSAAVLAHARNVTETTDLRVDVRVDGVDKILTAEAELALYRLIQEALLNVVKHADTDSARVSVARVGDNVEAVVSDCGVGFDVENAIAEGGLGLFGMYERAAYVGGSVNIISTGASGSTVRIAIPVREKQHG